MNKIAPRQTHLHQTLTCISNPKITSSWSVNGGEVPRRRLAQVVCRRQASIPGDEVTESQSDGPRSDEDTNRRHRFSSLTPGNKNEDELVNWAKWLPCRSVAHTSRNGWRDQTWQTHYHLNGHTHVLKRTRLRYLHTSRSLPSIDDLMDHDVDWRRDKISNGWQQVNLFSIYMSVRTETYLCLCTQTMYAQTHLEYINNVYIHA